MFLKSLRGMFSYESTKDVLFRVLLKPNTKTFFKSIRKVTDSVKIGFASQPISFLSLVLLPLLIGKFLTGFKVCIMLLMFLLCSGYIKENKLNLKINSSETQSYMESP